MQSLTRLLNIIILCNVGIATLQTKCMTSLIYLQNDGFWYQFNPLFHGIPHFTATGGAVIEIGANFSLNMGSHHVWMHDVHDK